MQGFILVFLIIFGVNILPVFAPPTWMVLSYITVRFGMPVVILALTGAVAATLGRIALAKMSHWLLRKNWLSKKTTQNVDHIKGHLEKHRTITFGLFLAYAFSPFPSNHLFIAYGLTNLPMRYIAFPFFIGRTCSYLFWTYVTSTVANEAASELLLDGKFLSIYFVITQSILLFGVYLFTQLDWQKLLKQKKIKFIH